MKSYTLRLTFRFAALLSLTAMIVLIAGGWLLWRLNLHSIDVLHRGEVEELSQILGPKPRERLGEVMGQLLSDADSDAWMYYTEIRDEHGAVLFRSRNMAGHDLMPGRKPVHTGVSFVAGLDDVFVTHHDSHGLHYVVASPLLPFNQVMETYTWMALLLFVVVSSIGIGVAHAFARSTQRPLRLIRETATGIDADNLGRRIPSPGGNDDLAALVTLLNSMFDRIQAAVEQNRRFAADASHELKTPLAVIRLHAEQLRPALQADPERCALLEDILEETGHLSQLVDSLLFLARTEGGGMQVQFETHPLPVIMRELEEDARVLAEDAGRRLEVVCLATQAIACDPVLIHQLVMNLLSNAIRHTPEGGLVQLEARTVSAGVELRVIDEGSGVAPADLNTIFERFRRLGDESSRGTRLIREGHGLGLAIARAIATLHKAQLSACNRNDRSGLIVTARFPCEPDK